MIKIYERGSKEYKALEAAAALMSAMDLTHDYFVTTAFYNWEDEVVWTTVKAESKKNNDPDAYYDAICKEEHDLITEVGTLESITQAVRQALKAVRK